MNIWIRKCVEVIIIFKEKSSKFTNDYVLARSEMDYISARSEMVNNKGTFMPLIVMKLLYKYANSFINYFCLSVTN